LSTTPGHENFQSEQDCEVFHIGGVDSKKLNHFCCTRCLLGGVLRESYNFPMREQ
jgi:hypothetical protein